MIRLFYLFLMACAIVLPIDVGAQTVERPTIWTTPDQRSEILQKIESQAWAKTFYSSFKARLHDEFSSYKQDPKLFLKGIPLDWESSKNSWPSFETVEDVTNNKDSNYRKALMTYLQIAIDCGVIYFLEEDEQYAQCASDILYTTIKGLEHLETSNQKSNGGWIYPKDHLREAREIGSQIPIIYDFIAPFLRRNGKAYDVVAKKEVTFPIDLAQQVFKTYARLAIEHGHTGSNWSVLEAPSLVHNTLALENSKERDSLLQFFLKEGTPYQDALPEILGKYDGKGSVYPETSQYSNGVASLITKLMVEIENYRPDLHLFRDYSVIPLALSRWDELRYPNGEIIRFGDGHREFDALYDAYEIAYKLGKQHKDSEFTQRFGTLLRTAIRNNHYDRAYLSNSRILRAHPYFDPLPILWYCDTLEGSIVERVLPRTDQLPHAGIYLQRNLSPTGSANDGLMCFVGGAQYVHGHASGMDMELYGCGEVLGVDNGRGSYRKNIHENYSRLFAAHNTVIVNGSSQGEGDWVNLGINTTTLEAMEPKPNQTAISPKHSFTITGFSDDRGDGAEAEQERLLALIRTSSNTGYYVDVFRSRSALPNEYHDYLYHNIGDDLEFLNKDLHLSSTPERYKGGEDTQWKQNRVYRNPGWHFFEKVQSSKAYEKNVELVFKTEKLKESPAYMNVFISGSPDREYSKAMAPKTYEVPSPYDKLKTPTLIVRKKGEAWKEPFAIIYEPACGPKGSVELVEKLTSKGSYAGMKVVSNIENTSIIQYVLTLEENSVYTDDSINLEFRGRFAVLTFDEAHRLREVYIGEGDYLKADDHEIVMDDGFKTAYVDFSKDSPVVSGKAKINGN